MKNFVLGFKLRKQNDIKGGGRWTNRQVKSRLGNPQFCHNVGNNLTLVRLSAAKMALVSKNEVLAIGCIESFEYGKSITVDGQFFILYQARSTSAGDGWASKEFRLLLCESGKMRDLPLQKVLYRDRAPKIHAEEGLKITQYGTWPYKSDFAEKNSVLDTEKMCLIT